MKEIVKLILVNFASFGVASMRISKMGVLEFIILCQVIPLVFNALILKTGKGALTENKKLLFTCMTSLINALFYVLFSKKFMLTPYFDSFVSSGNSSIGNLQVTVTDNLVSFSQICFVLLLNFVVSYLVLRFRKGGESVKG